MKKFLNIIFIIALSSLFYVCDDMNYPLPQIEFITPDAKVNSQPTFELKVRGQDFVRGAQIFFNGVAKETVFHNSQQLSTIITNAEITLPATAFNNTEDVTQNVVIPVKVKNPKPGGGESNSVNMELFNKYTLKEEVKVYETRYNNAHPEILSTEDGRIYVSTVGNTETNSATIFGSSRDGGENFENTKSVNEFISSVGVGFRVRMSYDLNQSIYHCWNYQTEIHHSMRGDISFDGGGSFTSAFVIAAIENSSIIDFRMGNFGSNNIFSAWSVYNEDGIGVVQYGMSRESGINFTTPVQLNLRPLTSPNIAFSIDKEIGTQNIAWCAKAAGESFEGLYFTKSDDYGATFSVPSHVYKPNKQSVILRNPINKISKNGNVFFAWLEGDKANPGQFKVMVAKTGSECKEFYYIELATLDNISLNALPKVFLEVDADENAYVVYMDSEQMIHFKRVDTNFTKVENIADPFTDTEEEIHDLAFTISSTGSLYLVYNKNVEYENDEDPDAEPETFVETFFVRSDQ